jgi:hypothetical protein
MIRYRLSAFYFLSIVLLASLTIVLPFIHLHPQVIHTDHSEQHTHAAVIHTIFSSDGMGYPTSSQDSIHPENSEEFSRSTIGWSFFPQRFSTESVSGGVDAPLVSLTSIWPRAVKGIALQRGPGFLRPSSWVSTPSSSRAPPFPSFSSQI